MSKILLPMVVFLAIGLVANAQERTVTGKVTSTEDGTPLPGVNVILKGTTVGTSTDAEGNYSLNLPSTGGTLIFSFIGLQSNEVEIGDRTVVDVSLSLDVTQLSEVIVTGYGVEQKRDLTGSIASLKGESILNLPVQSFDRALQGRTAGVQVQSLSGAPGGALSVRVRGPGSLANNTPLYIIDGVQVNAGGISGGGSNNALAAINPNDIDRIEVLKDAAAAAIYGAQSANGVVIITTKRGKAGRSNLDVSYQVGVTQPLNLYDVMNARQYAEIREEAYVNAGLNPAALPSGAYAQYGNPNDAGTLTPMDWVDAIFRDNAPFHVINLSLSGGTDRTSYYISTSYEAQEGQVIQSDWSRANFRINLEQKVSDKLKIGTNISVTRQNNFGTIADGNFVNGPFQAAFLLQPNSPAKASDGSWNPYPAHLPNTNAGHNFNYNIIQGVYEERREGTTVQTIGNFNASYEIIKGLTASVFAGVDFADNLYINERPSTIPVFSSFGGQVFHQNVRTLNWNTNGTINYSTTFNDAHTVSALVGYEFKERIQDFFNATGRGFAFPEIRALDAAATIFDVNGSVTNYKRAGGFVRANYDFKGKYYFNATFRRDGNSRFGSQNLYGNFYSVGAGWRISDESFMSGVGFLSELKLRLSYGVLGNAEGLGDFDSRGLYGGGGGQYLGLGGTGPTRLENDQFGWERAESINIGLDFGILENRIYGAIDIYREDTKDQLFDIPLPSDSGFGSIKGNAGNVRNEGVDVEIGAVIVDVGGFRWNSSFNISLLKNELTSLPNDEERIGNSLIVGEPIGFIWGIPYAGANPANGKAMWIDSLGNYTYNAQARDGRIIGYTLPKNWGGWTNTFTYKGFSLDVFFQYQTGNDVYLGDLANLAIAGASRGNQLVTQLDRWQQPGDVTNVPMPYEGGIRDGYNQTFPGSGNATGRYVSDASYIRLKQVTLAYNVPARLFGKIGLQRAKVFVQALNLATITNFAGIDPEVTGATNDAGFSSYGNYPNGRQFSAGVSLGF